LSRMPSEEKKALTFISAGQEVEGPYKRKSFFLFTWHPTQGRKDKFD